MKFVVMGSGGVGGHFGARLVQGGADVCFVARGAHAEAMRAQGLTLEGPDGKAQVTRLHVVEDPRDCGFVADCVIVAVKLWDTPHALQLIAPVVGPDTAVISLQNGVRKEQYLADAFPEANRMGGVCYIAAQIAAPGVIRQTGALQRIVFGEYDGTTSARAQAILEAFQRGGIDAQVSDDIRRVIWQKFVVLVGLSATTTAIRKTIGPIRSHTQSRALLHDLMREVVAVGRAQGVNLAPDQADTSLAQIDTFSPAMTSSMHHDLEAGNRLELPWLSGNVVELGTQLGVPTPMNRAVSDILALHARPETTTPKT